MEHDVGYPRAEEALRLLAAAVGAARLYPESSSLPAEAAEKFARRVDELTTSGPLRFVVNPDSFRIGDTVVAASNSQVATLAEALHAMQVGQLVIAPGMTLAETQVFVRLCNADPTAVRTAGGPRSVLVNANVRHIAVIEVSLRASEDEGLIGLDLTNADVEEIADAIRVCVEKRAIEAVDKAAYDEVAEAIGRLEEATRDLAMDRMAGAMMRLDEQTRMRVLAMALKPDTEGQRMQGMLDVIARMRPAALARLLRMVAAHADTDPRRVAGALNIPPETLKVLALILSPSASVEPDYGLSTTEQAERLAQEMSFAEDAEETERQVAAAAPSLSSARALATATAVSHSHADIDTIRAIGDVLPRAAADGAFTTVRVALRRLDELATDPAVTDTVQLVRARLGEPQVLADVCRAPKDDADAAIAGEILQAAGLMGAEVLLDSYVRSGERRRSLMRPVLRGMSESVLGVARQRLRHAEPAFAIGILRAMPDLGDRRAVPVVAEQLDHLEESVRFAAINALTSMPSADSATALIKALNHKEPETQRYVVRELGRLKLPQAVAPLSRALEDVFARTHETRKEIIFALENIGTVEAERALRLYEQHTLGLGRKVRELRRMATSAADSLAKKRGVDQS